MFRFFKNHIQGDVSMPHPKNYFRMKHWNKKRKKWENSQRSMIVNSVVFQNVCDVISIQNILLILIIYLFIYLFFIYLSIFQTKVNVFAADLKKKKKKKN